MCPRLAALFLWSRVMLIESREIDPGSSLQEPKAATSDLTKHNHTLMPRSRNLLAANLLTAALIVESGISDPIFATYALAARV